MNLLALVKELPTVFKIVWSVIQFVESRGKSTESKQSVALHLIVNAFERHKNFLTQVDKLSPEWRQTISSLLIDYTIWLLNEILGHDWKNHLAVSPMSWSDFESNIDNVVK